MLIAYTAMRHTHGLWAFGLLMALISSASCSRRTQDPNADKATKVTPDSAAAPSDGVSGTEVIIGQPAAFTGMAAALGIEVWRGASAAFSEVNDAGGVYGRKIKLVVADDAYRIDSAASTFVSLVEQEHVFTVFGGVGSPTLIRVLPALHQYRQETGLFYFSNFSGAQPQRQPPYADDVFNVRASYYQETVTIVDGLLASGRKKIGAFTTIESHTTAALARTLTERGMAIAKEVTFERDKQSWDISFRAHAETVKSAGIDAIMCSGSYQPCAAFIRDMRESGSKVPIYITSFAGPDQLRHLLAEQQKKTGNRLMYNIVFTSVVPHYDDVDTPLVRQYRAAIDRYKPTAPSISSKTGYSPPTPYTFDSLEGYVNARALLAVLEKTGKSLSRQSFYAAAEGMGRFDLGLRAPVEFSHTRHQALDKVWTFYLTSEGYKPANVAALTFE